MDDFAFLYEHAISGTRQTQALDRSIWNAAHLIALARLLNLQKMTGIDRLVPAVQIFLSARGASVLSELTFREPLENGKR